MKLKRFIPLLAISAILLFIWLNACSSSATEQEPKDQPSRTPTLSITHRQGTLAATLQSGETEAEATPTPFLGELIQERTPQPTATVGVLMQSIETFAARRGFLSTKFLGVRVVDWINLLISALIVLGGYLLGTWLIKRVLPSLVKRTATEFDDAVLEKVGPEVRWLVTVIILRFALTERLTFLSDRFSQTLSDIFFILILSFIVWILWKVTDLSGDQYSEKLVRDGREEIEPVIQMLAKFLQILTGIVGVTILLSYFGINVSTLTSALGIGGLAFSLAAQNTLADAIAGVIILIDQPFRVGDRIEIQGVGTWGDITEIGLRTTRIRTRDNRMVIVPNSILSQNQIVNYSFPDPRYRIQTHVYIPFGESVEEIRQLLIQAVQQVEGVLSDKPVDALYIDMTEGPIKFRMRWWIESYVDTRRMFDRVHTAIKQAMDDAGISSPITSDDLNLLIDPLTTERISRAFQSHPSDVSNTASSRIKKESEGNSKPNSDE